jgi:hypothetical protein
MPVEGSTGEQAEKPANIAAGKLLARPPPDRFARTKASRFSENPENAERLKNMPFADFPVRFRNTETSDYIRDPAPSGRHKDKRIISVCL